MLTRLDLEHFKCFESLELPLGNLTLLSGSNASGKSSVLQTLVLLSQTMRDNEWSSRLLLNGPELQLGTVTDVIDKVTGRREFALGVVNAGRTIRWDFETEDRRSMSAQVTSIEVAGTRYANPDLLHFLLPETLSPADQNLAQRLRRLTYLTAERVGPREIYPLADPETTNVVGPRGEHAPSLLYWRRDEPVVEALAVEGVLNKLLHQVTARMRQFFPGCSLDVQPILQANGVTLGIRTSEETDFHRPVHLGFGLTQAFPVIVAALAAAQHDLLLIENPEVHLHPAGQAAMGIFLTEVAAAGIQVLLETHSDHILNGVRRAVKAERIEADDVLIHFFRDRNLEGAQVVSPRIAPDGNIDTWPEGFFDQFDRDMNYFANWSE